MQRRAESVLVDDHVLGYIASLVRKTRQWPTLSLGASPRAGVAILRGARAVAALEGPRLRLARRRSRRRPAGLAASRDAHARGRDRGAICRRAPHRAHPVCRGSPAMTMIWPGRALGVALLVPALLSLVLFVTESVWPLVLVLDAGDRHGCARRPGHAARVRATADGAARGPGLLAGRAPGGRAGDRKPGPDDPLDAAARRRARRVLGRAGRVSRSRCRAGARRRLPIASCPRSEGPMSSSRSMRSSPAAWDSGGVSIAGRCGPRCGSIPIFTRSRGSRCWRAATG